MQGKVKASDTVKGLSAYNSRALCHTRTYQELAKYANPPCHIILTPGWPVLFCGPSFIVSTLQAGTTPILIVFGMTGPSTKRELNP